MQAKRRVKADVAGPRQKIAKSDKVDGNATGTKKLKSSLKNTPERGEGPVKKPQKAVVYSPNLQKKKKGNLKGVSGKSKVIKKGENKSKPLNGKKEVPKNKPGSSEGPVKKPQKAVEFSLLLNKNKKEVMKKDGNKSKTPVPKNKPEPSEGSVKKPQKFSLILKKNKKGDLNGVSDQSKVIKKDENKSKTPEGKKEVAKKPQKFGASSPNLKKKKKGDLKGVSDKSKVIKKGENKSKTPVGKKEVPINKKERKAFFKSSKSNYEIKTKSKQIWERFRDKKNKEKSSETADELYSQIKGHEKELIYSHDTSRVFENLMRSAPVSIKDAVYSELKDDIIKMSESKYAKHFVISVLRHGKSEQKSEIIRVLTKDVVRLMRHTEAATVVEDAFNEFATTAQRNAMVESFYGNYMKYKLEGDEKLQDIMKDSAKRQVIVEFMKQSLKSIVQKPVMVHSLVHKVLSDYFEYCNEADRDEMIDAVKEKVVEILHTRDGTNIAMKCIWHGSAKTRKVIVKSFKSFVTKICTEKKGRMVLMAIFDCVDDTELVKKVIIQEMINNLKDIVFHPDALLVVIYLLAKRNTSYVPPGIIDILKSGDGNKISKKDNDIRHKELLADIAPAIANFLAQHIKEMIFDQKFSNLIQVMIKFIPDHLNGVLDKIASLAAEPFEPSKLSHVIENQFGHVIVKKLLQSDKALREKLEKEEKRELFCEKLMKVVDRKDFLKWIKCGRGIFTLVLLYEVGVESIREVLRKVLQPVHKELKEDKFSGAQILITHLTKK